MSSFLPYHKTYESDPYYQDEYIKCYLSENQEIFKFRKDDGSQFLEFKAIKSPIEKIGQTSVSGQYYDLESVYGFGGYITNSTNEQFVKAALDELGERCEKENIIAHFMRFHPTNNFLENYASFLDFSAFNRKVVFVDVRREYDLVRQDYSSSLKRNINKAKREGLECREISKSVENRDLFMELYYETMERKGAESMYFFSKDYFKALFQLRSLRVFAAFYDNHKVAMILLLDSGVGQMYYHLGATHEDYYSLNPNPLMMDAAVKEQVERNAEFLFLGGGNSDDEQDPLFKFKKKFSKSYGDFEIAGHTFMPEVYNEYKEVARRENPDLGSFFLLYRFV